MSVTIREEQVTIESKVSLGATVSYTDKGTKSPAVVLIGIDIQTVRKYNLLYKSYLRGECL